MLFLLILSVILGAVVSGITGIGILFWVVAIIIFILGLPGSLIGSFIHGENEYSQDRADYRELMREIAEEERMDRYLDKIDELSDNYVDKPNIYIDNRQVHFHNHSVDNNQQRDKNGRFISTKKKKE